jgi:hypothetical protein
MVKGLYYAANTPADVPSAIFQGFLSAPFDDIPVLLPKTPELFFMMTEFLLTVPALRISVRPV